MAVFAEGVCTVMSDERATITDPLSYALASLSWSTWRAGVFSAHAPWGVQVVEGRGSFYAVRKGEAWLTSPDWSQPVRLKVGDIALIPAGSGHCLRDAPGGEPFVDFDSSRRETMPRESMAAATPTSRVLSTDFPWHTASASNPLHANLSSLICMNIGQYDQLRQVESLLAMLEDEQCRQHPGWQAIAKQLIEVIFYQSLRAFMTGTDQHLEAEGSSMQAVVSDPSIGLVVGLLHSQPGDAWTVATLARWVNMSRSAFSERFREVVGQPPLHYLTELRMSRARQMLASTDLGVKQIATLVGYESPSSFTNAFKRWNRVSPVAYRDRASSRKRLGPRASSRQHKLTRIIHGLWLRRVMAGGGEIPGGVWRIGCRTREVPPFPHRLAFGEVMFFGLSAQSMPKKSRAGRRPGWHESLWNNVRSRANLAG